MSKYDKNLKLRRVGSSVNLGVSAYHLAILETVRTIIAETDTSIDLSADEFQDKMPYGWARAEASFAMAWEMLGRQKIVVKGPHQKGWSHVRCYGLVDSVITYKNGFEENLPSILASDAPYDIRDICNTLNTYYVYVYKIEGKVVYVGKGTGSRIKHYGTKIEHNPELAELHKQGVKVEAVKIAEGLSEEMAVRLEEAYLLAVLGSGGSLFNKAIPKKIKEELKL